MPDSVRIEAAAYIGARKSQQDAVNRILSTDRLSAIAILADGIGGHGHGNLASKLAVDACTELLAPKIDALAAKPSDAPAILRDAANAANTRIAQAIQEYPAVAGMGATLVIAAVLRGKLYWCSVGDSHLSVYRPKVLRRLNANHSLASGLDDLVKIGAIDESAAQHSTKGSVLTSALTGQDIKEIDCPAKPFKLLGSDIVIICSDGIETLSQAEIEAHCRTEGAAGPAQLCAGLIDGAIQKAHPKQDNLSVVAMLHAA